MFDFSYFPTLETRRCRLRRLTHADAPALVSIFGNPDVLRYMNDPAVDTPEKAAELVDWMNGHFDSGHAVRWGITLKEQGDAVIGTCGFHYYDRDNRHADIGYDLHPAYWGQGLMTEVVHTLVNWCFVELDLHRIQADCTAGNIASERVLLKVGFTHEGTWRERDFEHGRFVDIRQFGLLAREYPPAEPAPQS